MDGSEKEAAIVDVNLNIKVPAVEMLLKYAASGIGAVAGSILAPRWRARQAAAVRRIEAEAEGDSLKLIAKAQTEARQILVEPGNAGSGILEIGPDGGITQRIEYQEKKRQANIAAVVQDAAAELGSKQVPEHEPDPDLTARFFDCVQDVSSDDMRKLWAKLLAGEVESPSRSSLKTLDILRNMTTQDARMFRDMCDFIINGLIFHPYEPQNAHGFYNFIEVLNLESIGLLNSGSSLNFTWDFSDGTAHLFYQDRILEITKIGDVNQVNIPIIVVTPPGRELYRIMEHRFRADYLQSLSRFLNEKSCALSFARVIEKLPDGQFTHTSFIPIELEPEQPGGAAP